MFSLFETRRLNPANLATNEMKIRTYFSEEAVSQAGLDPTRFPQTPEEVQKAEEAIALDVKKLSLVEHEKIVFDVLGMTTSARPPLDPQDENNDSEDPALEICSGLETPDPGHGSQESTFDEISDALKEVMTQRTHSASREMSEPYRYARQHYAGYVQSKALWLRFLRSSEGNLEQACDSILQHFRIKEELFGRTSVLGRDVRWGDLTKGAQEILKLGNMQVLPTPDAAGRIVLAYRFRHYDALEDLARCHWYFLNSCLRDTTAQTKGFVIVFFLVDAPTFRLLDDFPVIRRIQFVLSGIPERVAGAHFCGNDSWVKRLVSGIQLFLTADARARLRTHFCPRLDEIHFELQTFGIPTDECPMSVDGVWDTSQHECWLRLQQARDAKTIEMEEKRARRSRSEEEEEESDEVAVYLPGRFDVLFGQHKSIRQHTGNLRAMHLVQMHWNQYETANKYQKTEVADRIVGIIVEESQGRFLRWDAHEQGWIPVDHDTARDKIAHYFRYLRSKVPKKSATVLTGMDPSTVPSSSSATQPLPSLPRSSSTRPKRQSPSSLSPDLKRQA